MKQELQLQKPYVFAISLVQGLLLTLLYQSIEHDVWPATNMVWLVSLITLCISLPMLTLLSINQRNVTSLLKWLIPYTILLSCLGGYVGLQQEPQNILGNNNDFLIFVFTFSALVASFKALMYIQQFSAGEKLDYSRLFQLSWQNFIIFGEALLFTLIFWAILHLGAGLFSVLDINFFQNLLREEWFSIPILTVAFGFATHIFRHISHTVDNIAMILQTLIKFLLPALTIVSLGFLSTLPFTGMEKLWGTGSGSMLIMWLQALTLFFVNAAYQYQTQEHPYPNVVHRIVFIGVGLLPVYSAISAYGLWLRVEQYGLTVDRCWAILVWFVLFCFSVGYLAGIVTKRDKWLATLTQVNIKMGLVVLALTLMVNSPLLDFQQMSAKSQIARLDVNNIDDFDLWYFRRSLGRQGYLALQQVKEEMKTTHPEFVTLIDESYQPTFESENEDRSFAAFEQHLRYWPNQDSTPMSLVKAVYKEVEDRNWRRIDSSAYYFLAIDMNGDGQLEHVFIVDGNDQFMQANIWTHNGQQWTGRVMSISNPSEVRELSKLINDSDVSTVAPIWQDLKIGDVKIKVTN